MSNFIRKARLADLPQLQAIYNDAVLHSTATFDLSPRDDADRLAWFQAHQGKYLLLVYETDGVIAGYASLSRYRERPAFDGAVELSIYLHPDFRGQHIGHALMQKILAFAEQRPDIDTVISLITSENALSIHLHEAFGFSLCGVIRHCGRKFGRCLDLSIYQITFA